MIHRIVITITPRTFIKLGMIETHYCLGLRQSLHLIVPRTLTLRERLTRNTSAEYKPHQTASHTRSQVRYPDTVNTCYYYYYRYNMHTSQHECYTTIFYPAFVHRWCTKLNCTTPHYTTPHYTTLHFAKLILKKLHRRVHTQQSRLQTLRKWNIRHTKMQDGRRSVRIFHFSRHR